MGAGVRMVRRHGHGMRMKSGWMWGGAALLVLAGLAVTWWLASPSGAPRATALVGNVAAGKHAFVRCAECHQIGPSARGGFGPQLNGLLGRRAASTADYQYSDAMKHAGIVWTADNVAAFLRGPSTMVPGTKMGFWGIRDEQQIADLLAYLRTQK